MTKTAQYEGFILVLTFGVLTLLPRDPVKSFRYTLDIDCRNVAGVLDDTPIFASIWLAVRRPGRVPRWKDREAE